MPVYPAAAGNARCASPGCWCRDRAPRYPSDLTDEQWAVLEPRAREVMAELTVAAGRPMVHDLRAVCDAVASANATDHLVLFRRSAVTSSSLRASAAVRVSLSGSSGCGASISVHGFLEI